MALDIPMPESPGDSLLKGLSTGSDLIHKMMLNKYYGQLHPSGNVANAMYVEQLRQLYGDNDPRYIQAKAAHDLALKQGESLIDYRDILNQTAGIRATSPLGKIIAEGKGRGAQDILNRRNQGAAHPGVGDNSGYEYDQNGNNVVGSAADVAAAGGNAPDNNPRTPDEREAYMREINKKTSDAQTRNKLNFATNLDKTRNSINQEDLTRYSGLKGTGTWLKDAKDALLGKPSDQWIAHNNAVTSASLMRDQMRQFYGDSIQPKALKRLDELTNPSTWYKDPKVAQAQWQQLNKVLDVETETYRNKGTSPIQLGGLDYKNGQFVSGKGSQGKASNNAPSPTNSGNEGGTFDLQKVAPQLLQISPNYTIGKLKEIAKKNNTTLDNVINQIFTKQGRRQ